MNKIFIYHNVKYDMNVVIDRQIMFNNLKGVCAHGSIKNLIEIKEYVDLYFSDKPLVLAARHKNNDIIKYLIEHDTNNLYSNRFLSAILAISANENNTEIVKYLIKHPKVSPEANNAIAFSNAWTHRNYAVCDILLNDKRVLKYVINNIQFEHLTKYIKNKLIQILNLKNSSELKMTMII